MVIPETQLKLARAYLRKGNAGAARAAACKGLSSYGYSTIAHLLRQYRSPGPAIQALTKAIQNRGDQTEVTP